MFGVISNYRGFAMFVVAFSIALGIDKLFKLEGESLDRIIGGLLLILFDLPYRLISKQGHWLIPDRGGSILYVPAWCMGVVWTIIGIYFALQVVEA